MNPEIIMVVAILGGLIILLAMGLEVAWAIGLTAAVGLWFFLNQPLDEFAWRSWTTLYSFTLTAAPLFIFMSSILANTGVTKHLIDAVEKWMGRLPGGLLNTVIGGNAVFGAMCGGSLSATIVFGKVVFPEMEKRGYDPGLSLGVIAVSSILSSLIPPSIVLVLYGSWQRVSIVSLFAAGMIPGIMMAILFILTIVIRAKLNPKLVPALPKVSWTERLTALKKIFPFVLLIIAMLYAIFGGIMTPTESAALGAFLSMALSLAYRRLSWKIIRTSLHDTVRVTSFVLFIMAIATVLSHVFNSAGITGGVKDFVLGLGLGKYGTLGLFLVMYLVLGMFFDGWSMLFLTFPFVIPIIIALKINLIWWGIMYVLVSEQSSVTPPFGLNLFVLHNIARQHSIGTIARGSFPFLIPVYINVIILTAFPQLVLWLPSLLSR